MLSCVPDIEIKLIYKFNLTTKIIAGWKNSLFGMTILYKHLKPIDFLR